ncbi:MAG: hypothetical protein IH592_12925 [Bacteroidales bacterium]|nr:hypothetical protein [Bacteroidales bacterium]
MKRTVLSILFIASLFALAQGQQVPDTAYRPYIAHPAYTTGCCSTLFTGSTADEDA